MIFLFKVDFQKAFGSINWNYLDSTRCQMNYGTRWRRWIMGCLSSSRASVIVNRSTTKEFLISKGVRQGDPPSSFLFIITMEGSSLAIKNACDKYLIHKWSSQGMNRPCPIFLRRRCDICWQFRVGPALRIFQQYWSFFILPRVLRSTSWNPDYLVLASHYLMNKIWLESMVVKVDTFPFSYLGVPVGANMGLKKHWKPIVDKFRSRLSDWKANLLSLGGRVTFIKSVLNSLPTNYISLFKTPKV